MSWALLVLAAYLLGSISFSLLIVRSMRGFDVREQGSGNAGATNVLRLVGRGPAAAVLLLDVAKGVVPVLTARALGAPGPVVGLTAVATVVGHVFPVFHGFRGGKGVATVTGALGSLAPWPALLSLAVFVVVVAATRYVALGSIAAVTGFPLWIWLGGRTEWTPPPPVWLMASAVAIALLIVGKHGVNVRRMLAGTEHRLGDSRPREKVA